MDSVELLSESTIKIEEVKLEPVDNGDENIEDFQRSVTVKSELGTFGAASQWQDDSEEEEVKPPVTLFFQPNEELEESAGGQQDPLASSDNLLHSGKVKMEKTEDRLLSPGWRGGFREAEAQRHVQWPLESGSLGNLGCDVSMAPEHTFVKSAFPDAKSFQCTMYTRSSPETNCPDCDVPKERHISYECGECKKRFSSKWNLFSHSRSHMDERPYECGECKKRFRWKSNLAAHSRIHAGYKPYECGECKKRFSSKWNLVAHSRTHTGEKPYECSECKKRFTLKGDVIRHSRIHTCERPYECGECKKRFTSKGSVIRHSRIHTWETL